MNWMDYWNGTPTIYVSPRHQQAHDFDIAFSIIRFIRQPGMRVLDYGCGDATRAQFVASRCAELLLWDSAASVRQRLNGRYRGRQNISVLSPEALAAIEPNSIDLITIVSVIQYLDAEALAQVLSCCKRFLSKDGSLVVADIIPPDVRIRHDAWQLLHFAFAEGFLCSAVFGMCRSAFSGYAKLRSRLRLTKYSEAEFQHVLAQHGFSGQKLDRNFGHNHLRFAVEARHKPAAVTLAQSAPCDNVVEPGGS